MYIPYSGVLVYSSESSVYTVENHSAYYALYKRVLHIVQEWGPEGQNHTAQCV